VRARGWSIVATVVGAALLFLGVLAGVVNREVLDGPRFAAHIDGVRRDPAVARQVATAITDQMIAADPDLIAVRPLVQSAATSLVASAVFSPIVRASAAQIHEAFTTENSEQVVLRLADVGAVLAGVLPALAPDAAARLPANLDVTLAQVGGQTFAARTIHLARVVGLLAWLLPLLALVAFALGLWLAPDRTRGAMRTGWGVVTAGVGVGLVAFAGALFASARDEDTLHGALVAAGWREFGGRLWWAAGIAVTAGALLVAAAAARIPEVDLAVLARQVASRVTHRPHERGARIGRGVALAAVGAGAVLRPTLVFGVLAAAVGVTLFLAGVGEIAAAAGARRTTADDRSRAPRWLAATAAVVAVGLVVGLTVVDAGPVDRQVDAAATSNGACNGHVQLCDRRYTDVAFPGTHNAMSAADEPGWFIPEQPTGLVGQLQAGVRVLLFDTWYGQTTDRPGVVATAPGNYDSALAEATRDFGPAVVASALRIRDAVTTTPTGPVRPYLCHGLCEIGATDWEQEMVRVRAWLDANPREVVSFFIEDYVTPADTAALFGRAGLLPYVFTPTGGQPWPTLRQMIDSGRRLVVLMENHGGGTAYPWLLPGFDWVQDTPFTNPTEADLSCAPNRGQPSNPLFLVNYWLSNFRTLVSDAKKINAYAVLAPYLARCRQERGRIPNYVAVNFYDQGDVFRAVDELNGVR
jgi:hypothetical protein